MIKFPCDISPCNIPSVSHAIWVAAILRYTISRCISVRVPKSDIFCNIAYCMLHWCKIPLWRTTWGNSQARHRTLLLVHHRPLKNWNINEVRHKRCGNTRGSKARRMFPCTFSLSPCLGFPRRECTAGIRKFKKKFCILVHIYFDILMHNYVQRSFTSAACPGTHLFFLYNFLESKHKILISFK